MAQHTYEHGRDENHREGSESNAHQEGREFGLVVDEQLVGELKDSAHSKHFLLDCIPQALKEKGYYPGFRHDVTLVTASCVSFHIPGPCTAIVWKWVCIFTLNTWGCRVRKAEKHA